MQYQDFAENASVRLSFGRDFVDMFFRGTHMLCVRGCAA